MIEIEKVDKLSNLELSELVAEFVGLKTQKEDDHLFMKIDRGAKEAEQWILYNPTSYWYQAGPIIEQYKIELSYHEHNGQLIWIACADNIAYADGDDPNVLRAAMLAFVKLGIINYKKQMGPQIHLLPGDKEGDNALIKM